MTQVLQLGYLAFEVSSLPAWRSFAEQTLGLTLGEELPNGGFSLRMDRYPQRFFVEPGPLDDASAIGWEVADRAALAALAAKLPEHVVGTPEQCARRKVEALIKFDDPAGTPTEVFCGPRLEPAAPTPVLCSRFIADDLGLGHVVIGADDPARSIAFYRDVLGFRLSDEIRCVYFGHEVDIAFFHVNKRHHSLAIGKRQRKRIHHFMLEAAAMDDVGLCFDRALRAQVPIMQTLGRHPNDRMFSFYAKTPSGLQFEFGCGGREIDDSTWQPTTYDRISEWGHHPPIVFASREGKRP
ncbi:MAG TPA: VOC family protein [Polyangiales bacterium]|nr:VOC family protein [Polyangiales bacterium]